MKNYQKKEKYSATPILSMEMPLMEQTPRKKKAGIIVGIIIAIVTFFICMAGVIIGKTVGGKFSKAASILGGVILIIIGLEVFITGVF